MKCVTPMFREYIEYSPEEKLRMKADGLKQYNIVHKREDVMKDLQNYPNAIRKLEELNEQNIAAGSPIRWGTIPCKNCFACKLNYSAEWATRIMLECQKSENNYFITLTYNNEWLPIADHITVPEKLKSCFGEKIIYHEYDYKKDFNPKWLEGTVWEEHVHTFIHRLREHVRYKYFQELQYYYCAEYGEKTHRPHYHLILMNCPLDLNQFYDFYVDERYKTHWKSTELEKYWGQKDKCGIYHKYGMIDVAEVEWSCAAYVARYCMKKLLDYDKTDKDYAKEGKLKEFVRMSRRIGRDYYENNWKKIYDTDEIIQRTVKGNIGSLKPPKAFDRIMEREHPLEFEMIKQSRKKAAERSAQLQRELTDYTDLKQLELAAEKVAIKTKQLPRILDT